MSDWDDFDPAEYLDADELNAFDEPLSLTPLEAVKNRTAAQVFALVAVESNYGPDPEEAAESWRELVHDLARMALVNGRPTGNADADALARLIRKHVALNYRRRATAAARLLSASGVWDDRALLLAVADGRAAIVAMLATETDEYRRAVLLLALSILDALAQVPVVELEAVDNDNEPTAVECAHHRHRRRRAGPCLHRPHLVHARQGDDPYPPRAESSQACGANRPRLSSNPGGSR